MRIFRQHPIALLTVAAGLALYVGCSSDSESDSGGSGASSSSGGATSSGGTLNLGGDSSNVGGGSSVVGGAGAVIVGGANGGKLPIINSDGTAICGDHTCQCSDGMDNDDDGQPDGLDVECQGPLDDDESSFATGIPGDNRDGSWLDCFFDGNSGAGDDGCKYKPECLTGGLAPDDKDCQISQECKDFCAARTPNGCDCFGCCTIDLGGGDTVDILTTTGCSIEQIDDEKACPRCMKTAACENTCGTCELCPGKTAADLPDSCGNYGGGGAPSGGGSNYGGGPGYTCEGGTVCGDSLPCAGAYYCSLGCCIPVVK